MYILSIIIIINTCVCIYIYIYIYIYTHMYNTNRLLFMQAACVSCYMVRDFKDTVLFVYAPFQRFFEKCLV